MTRIACKRLVISLLMLLAIASWLGYANFLGGLPGFYPLAVWHSLIFSPIVSLVVLLGLHGWILLLVVAVSLGLLTLYFRRRRLRLTLAALLIWPLLIAILLPAMIGFSPGQRVVIAPWGQVYCTAYSSLWLDDNYGDVRLFKCDRTGILCRQVHKHYSVVDAQESIPLEYDAAQDLFRLGTTDEIMYVRSRTKTLCSAKNIDPYATTGGSCSKDGKTLAKSTRSN